jgi:hypothetical protein
VDDTWRLEPTVEDIDHGWVDDVDAVVKHRYDESQNKRNGKFATIVSSEDARRAEGIGNARFR